MFGITWAQISGVVQRGLMFVAGVAVAKGWLAQDLVIPIVGALMAVAGWAWGVQTNTTSALVAKVDAIAKLPDSPVQAVITTADAKGMELANSIPGSTTIPAGTLQATSMAKAA